MECVTLMKTFNILCPFCGEEFTPDEVRFRFKLGDITGNSFDDSDVYFSCSPDSSEMKEFCVKYNLSGSLIKENEIPREMYFKKIGSHNTINPSSRIRTCKNIECNQVLSVNAGLYPPKTGIFFLGLKGVGKTVMITTLINTLNSIATKFDARLSPYNKTVADEYKENYYNVMYRNRELPDATITHNQLAYEWVNSKQKSKITGITFSDIKGEDANNMAVTLQSKAGMAIRNSNAFIVVIDYKSILEDDFMLNETIEIFGMVLANAFRAKDPGKYLAVVLSKSDELINYENEQIFARNEVSVSEIYKDIEYKEFQNFNKDRNDINRKLIEFLKADCPALVLAAQEIFAPQNIGYFAVSSLGFEPVDGKLKEKPRPIRVEEPVLWLLDKMGFLFTKEEPESQHPAKKGFWR